MDLLLWCFISERWDRPVETIEESDHKLKALRPRSPPRPSRTAGGGRDQRHAGRAAGGTGRVVVVDEVVVVPFNDLSIKVFAVKVYADQDLQLGQRPGHPGGQQE